VYVIFSIHFLYKTTKSSFFLTPVAPVTFPHFCSVLLSGAPVSHCQLQGSCHLEAIVPLALTLKRSIPQCVSDIGLKKTPPIADPHSQTSHSHATRSDSSLFTRQNGVKKPINDNTETTPVGAWGGREPRRRRRMLRPPHDCPTQTVGHTCAVLIARMYAFEFDNINHHANVSMFPLEDSEAPNGDFLSQICQ